MGKNAARFRNEFRDLYYGSFPKVDRKRGRRDLEKPWLDDPDFKQLVEKKGNLYSRKLWGRLMEEGVARLGRSRFQGGSLHYHSHPGHGEESEGSVGEKKCRARGLH